MTVSTTATRIRYLGNGATTLFAVPFRFLAAGDLAVTLVDAEGIETLQTLGIHYSVSGADAAAGGSITMVTAPAVGVTLVIRRATARLQSTDYRSGDSFPAETHERALDRETMIAQEIGEEAARAVKAAIDEDGYTLPRLASRIGVVKLFGHGNDGAFAMIETSSLKGDPGGNAMAIGLFNVASTLSIPVGTDIVHTSGYSAVGRGAARYQYDAAVDAVYVAANPRSSFRSLNGRGFRLYEQVVTTMMVGGKADGTDDVAALDAFVALLGDGIHGRIDGAHVISRQIAITQKSDFVIDATAEGSLKLADGAPCIDGYSALFFDRCTDFELSDVSIDANRANRVPAETPAHTVKFESCKRFRVSDVSLANAVCDGFYLRSVTPADISTHCSDYIFERCSSTNAYRQGMSVIQGHNGTYLDCSFTGTNGTAPEAGVDLESDGGDPAGSITNQRFIRCKCAGNNGYGLLMGGPVVLDYVLIAECDFEDNLKGAIQYQSKSGHIQNCTFAGATNSMTRGMIDLGAGAEIGNLVIENPIVRRFTSTTKLFLYVHSVAYGRVILKNPNIDSVAMLAQFDAPKCAILGGVVEAMTVNFGVAINGSDGRVEGVTFNAVKDCAVLLQGARGRVVGNTFAEPSSNADSIVRAAAGTRHVIESNTFVRAADAAGGTIKVDAGATVSNLSNNRQFGFGAAPMTLTGTVHCKRGNIANDVLLSETAIVP